MRFNQSSYRLISRLSLVTFMIVTAMFFVGSTASAQKASYLREVREFFGLEETTQVPGGPQSFKVSDQAPAPTRSCAASSQNPIAINGEAETAPLVNCISTVLVGGGGTSGNERAPNANFRFGRSIYLITPAEMAAAGYQSGTSVTSIGWNYSTGGGTAASAPLIIYMQNTSDTTNTASTTWTTAIAGLTTVHNATTALPSAAGPFDVTLSGGSAFTYTGGGLYIAFDWGQYTGTLTTVAAVSCNTNLTNGLLGAQSSTAAPATLAASAFRPETRLNSNTQSDAGVSTNITYGELPYGLVPAQTVKATITNNGALALTNVPVTLTVSGADNFTNTQTVASLSACGGQATVTFTSFTPSAVGSDTVQVTVPNDDITVNNTLSKPLSITQKSYSYKIPGSTSSGGVGLTTAGAFVAKFTTTAANAITDVKLEFPAVAATTYKVAIYGDSGTGTPATGTPLYLDSASRTVAAAGPVQITLPAPLAIPAGNYYVGIQQTNTTNAGLGYDSESPIRTGSFFFATALPVTTWNDEAPANPFKLNIGINLQNVATAAGVDVSGRVITNEGRGLRNAIVAIRDEGGNTRTVITGPLGSYSFDDVEAGQTYVVSVMSRRYSFSPRVIQITDNIADLDFTPDQQLNGSR